MTLIVITIITITVVMLVITRIYIYTYTCIYIYTHRYLRFRGLDRRVPACKVLTTSQDWTARIWNLQGELEARKKSAPNCTRNITLI